MKKLLILKQVAVVGFATVVGSAVAMADNSAAIQAALKGVETATSDTTTATTPSAITIVGIIFTAVITVAIVKRMLFGAK